ncbi:MAG: Glycosyl transferase, family 2 [Candidatus Collierbacteria bacterium GW2011_GWB1_44_6]|uniref:Glycosyl transferase, family 2 n=2 Tax=Candidatus Collieribacteriota TaxID=1752725 RepID=A0A0G1MP17_9BACT|nr:MAG: Glycosyl transferase, family 2 [Candidatus Collierbacteria bacterium GW2011_GWC2_43_12]KKT73754.1 MAG: Glycosyl transferase, family 2 [Candidatus Collierbacteria bacterium GW2011_GWB1_44_6]KKT83932.1 MAG: Glycosyl transferase, family 2 [Microgenomates group bacterium GW2011_GWC1_44_9]
MKISVVIPTYNRPGLALGLAKQIRKFEPGAEIIIVDQSDKKEDPKEIKKLDVVYIENSKANTSIAKNIGLARVTGEIVFFFDDDVEITPKTIKAHLAEYADKKILGVAGRVINDGEKMPQDTDAVTGKTDKYLASFTMNFWGTRRQFVQFPYGCNMSFRRSILEKLRGFDEKIPPPGFEETDLGLRVTKLGRMIFSPDALVYHHRASSGGTRMPRDKWFKNYYWIYGRMIARHVSFPLNLVSMFRIKMRVLKEYPLALPNLISGYFS